MDRLSSMALFVEVVKSKSFTAAADRLGLSRAQASKSLMQLEKYLGTRLLNRTTRHLSLTETGRVYFERCSDILQDIEEIEDMAGEQTATPNGELRLGGPTSFGILHLNKAITEYLKKHPQVTLSVSYADRFFDVVAEGFDLVIRIADLEDSSLIARKIAPCKRVLCASPEYLEKNGEPGTVQELALHQCLTYANESKPDNWQLHSKRGIESVKVSGPVCADNGDILKTAAVSGLGIASLPSFIAGPDLCAGRLQTVMPGYYLPELSIYAIFPSRRYLSAKVRTFVDFLSDYFEGTPDWDKYHSR